MIALMFDHIFSVYIVLALLVLICILLIFRSKQRKHRVAQGRMAGTDWVTNHLDLARAYIEMNETEQAHALLQKVVRDGDDRYRKQAKALLAQLKQAIQ